MTSSPSLPHQIEWFVQEAAQFSGVLKLNEPLARYTYYQIGGPARIVAVPKSKEDLNWLRAGIEATQIPFFIMGRGSNLLVSDQGYEGLIIQMSKANMALSEHGDQVIAGASLPLVTLLNHASQKGWAGLEFLVGIPGSVGGAVYMNAGNHLGEVKDGLHSVEAVNLGSLNLMWTQFQKEELRFDYRRNLFLPQGSLVWSASWKIRREDPVLVKGKIQENLKRRKETQPIDLPSCGSVFKNPKDFGMRAWQVLDRLGLRGVRVGNAQFSEKHPNFIVNCGKASSSDVKQLIDLAKARARAELGIPLTEEVVYLGAQYF